MYGFGDAKQPSAESVDCVEALGKVFDSRPLAIRVDGQIHVNQSLTLLPFFPFPFPSPLLYDSIGKDGLAGSKVCRE